MQLVPKPKRYQPPDIGPVIYFNYKDYEEKTERKNISVLIDYIGDKIDEMYDSKIPLSRMEIEEYIQTLKDMIDEGSRNEDIMKKYIEYLQDLLNEDREIVDDVLKAPIRVTSVYIISPQRAHNRRMVAGIFNSLQTDYGRLQGLIKHKDYYQDHGNVSFTLEGKQFIDALIRHKIFRREDIYGKVFKSPREFTKLKRLRERWLKMKKEYFDKQGLDMDGNPLSKSSSASASVSSEQNSKSSPKTSKRKTSK